MKNLLKSMNSNKTAYTLLVISLTIAITLVNIGYMNFQRIEASFQEVSKQSYKYNFIISINSEEEFTIEKKLSLMEEYLKNFQVTITERVQVVNNDVSFVDFVSTKSYPEKNPQIIKGRYFNIGENEKVAVVGKKVNVDDGNITVSGDTYKVIGIVGSSIEDSGMNEKVYIPLGAIPERIKNNFSYFTEINLKSDKDRYDNEVTAFMKVVSTISNSEINIFENEQFHESGLFNWTKNDSNMIKMTRLYILALINCMIMGYFASVDRRKEVSIMKVHGANNLHIIIKYLFEYLLIGIFAALVSIIFINVYKNISFQWLNIEIKISLITILISIIVAVCSSFIASLAPILNALKVQPAEVLKE